MLQTVENIILTHTHGLVMLAAIVCVIGSCLCAILSRQLLQAMGRRRYVQLFLTSLIAGTTIWSTHFIAMLAYNPNGPHGYEPVLTIASLGIAVAGSCVACFGLAFGRKPWSFIPNGILFGLTISTVHYVGMSAYLVQGTLIWNGTTQLLSIGSGTFMGSLAFHRLAYPRTRYCWAGSAFFMVLAICTMHFIGMSAFEIQTDPALAVPPQVISDKTLATLVIAVTSVIILVGFASVSIEQDVKFRAKSQLMYASLHDALTSLPNRLGLERHFEEIDAHLKTTSSVHAAVLSIDLTAFKEVNDLFGHPCGDIVLKTISARLSASLEDGEYIARVGGDEFVAVQTGCGDDDVLAFAERLKKVINEAVDVKDKSATVDAAIGIATTSSDGRDLHALLQKSNLAMYRAKTESDISICLFNSEIDEQGQIKLLLLQDLRQALTRDEFELAYQFQNDINTNEVTGFEALLRWNHPTLGRVSPDEFIPIAEETGLIRPIGLWVLRTACLEAAQWEQPLNIAVNVAPQQLIQPCFLENVSDILFETGLSPERLELEITEASIIDEQVNTLDVMIRLQNMGIRIAMDDFGTGYSSLAMLQKFPFDKIKIDRSFVQDVHQNEQRAAIVRSTLLLADAFAIPVLAEGVEQEDELNFLRTINCNAVQGFYFGKPMNLVDLHTALEHLKTREASRNIA